MAIFQRSSPSPCFFFFLVLVLFLGLLPVVEGFSVRSHWKAAQPCRPLQLEGTPQSLQLSPLKQRIEEIPRYSLALFASSKDDVRAPKAEAFDPEQFLLPLVGVVLTMGIAVAARLGYTPEDALMAVQTFVSNPQATLNSGIESVKDMGPLGALYFGLFYFVAETLAVPATPLALSAGYLFGLPEGFAVVLAAATLAACVGFFVGKTYLRTYVERLLEENPTFAKLDRAVGEQGFKLLVLVRLSPIFPFSISNYVYGASSIDFTPYFWGTLLGFIPSTLAYVYTGMVGKDVLLGSGSQEWYVYAGGLAVLATLLKLVTDVATGIVEAIDDDKEK
jgi:uncharacterized membrane protein YdjX (TVP38/TMEM64 family)